MLNRFAFVCKRVLAKCGFNCFKAAEHRGGSREEITANMSLKEWIEFNKNIPFIKVDDYFHFKPLTSAL
jgi:hypothetical protein